MFGSTTKAEVKGKDIVLTITGDRQGRDRRDPDARADAPQGEGRERRGRGSAHDQKGIVGGGKGICPVYFGEGGKGTSKKDAKGVVITITPRTSRALKTTIDERITKAADWVKENVKDGDKGNTGGVGGGKGGHGRTTPARATPRARSARATARAAAAAPAAAAARARAAAAPATRTGSGS